MNLEQQEKAEMLRDFERGRRLFITTHSEGWNDVLDLLEAEVIASEFRLINQPAGASDELLRDLHSHARAARTIFERFQLRIAAQIESGKEVPTYNPHELDYQTNNL